MARILLVFNIIVILVISGWLVTVFNGMDIEWLTNCVEVLVVGQFTIVVHKTIWRK